MPDRMGSKTESDRVPLSEAITALRIAIRDSAKRAEALDPSERFKITEVEIEITAVAEDIVEGGGEIGWWVFKANAKASVKEGTTHIVRLKLNVGDVEVGSLERID